MDDRVLFEKIKIGDEKAFERLFRKYYSSLLRFSWGFVKSEAIAEEIIQEIFTKIWERRKTLTINRSLKSYLFRAVQNESLDYLKHQKIVREWDQEKKAMHKEKPKADLLNKDLHYKLLLAEVEKAIKSLPERRRLIFILSRYQDMTYKEIAELLDISVNTVETQISRALTTLRDNFSHLLVLSLAVTTLAT